MSTPKLFGVAMTGEANGGQMVWSLRVGDLDAQIWWGELTQQWCGDLQPFGYEVVHGRTLNQAARRLESKIRTHVRVMMRAITKAPEAT
jgi:hypothetical protein